MLWSLVHEFGAYRRWSCGCCCCCCFYSSTYQICCGFLPFCPFSMCTHTHTASTHAFHFVQSHFVYMNFAKYFRFAHFLLVRSIWISFYLSLIFAHSQLLPVKLVDKFLNICPDLGCFFSESLFDFRSCSYKCQAFFFDFSCCPSTQGWRTNM